jgi:hypothetical protein
MGKREGREKRNEGKKKEGRKERVGLEGDMLSFCSGSHKARNDGDELENEKTLCLHSCSSRLRRNRERRAEEREQDGDLLSLSFSTYLSLSLSAFSRQ